jgi:hypothetical protein
LFIYWPLATMVAAAVIAGEGVHVGVVIDCWRRKKEHEASKPSGLDGSFRKRHILITCSLFILLLDTDDMPLVVMRVRFFLVLLVYSMFLLLQDQAAGRSMCRAKTQIENPLSLRPKIQW